MVFVGDIEKERVFRAPASALSARKDFYTLVHNDDAELVDKVWSLYERDFAEALTPLMTTGLSAITWARTLVPFVAAMTVRGPDFDTRFGARTTSDGVRYTDLARSPDNTNMARLMELQRNLAPVLTARWIVSAVLTGDPLITNDVGFAATLDQETGRLGLAIALTPGHALTVTPREAGRVAVADGGLWSADVEHRFMEPENQAGFNEALVEGAQRFIFGHDEALVGRLLARRKSGRRPGAVPEPGELGFLTGADARLHEFVWHRLVGALTRPPDDPEPTSFEMRPEALVLGWCPPVILPIVERVHRPDVFRVKDEIWAYLHKAEASDGPRIVPPAVPSGDDSIDRHPLYGNTSGKS